MAIPIRLDVGPGSENIPDKYQDKLFDLSYNGIEIMPKDLETFPMPWDAAAVIEGDNFILEGGAGPSGFGKASVEIPLRNVKQYLEISIVANDEEAETFLTELFANYGWL